MKERYIPKIDFNHVAWEWLATPMSYQKNLQKARQHTNIMDKYLQEEIPLKRVAGLLGDQNSTNSIGFIPKAFKIETNY